MPATDATAELARLRRCVGDLIAVLAIPAIVSGRAPDAIVRALLDVLVGMLHLDFACACRAGRDRSERIVRRGGEGVKRHALPAQLRSAVDAWLRGSPSGTPFVVEGKHARVVIVPVRLGLGTPGGWVLAGAARADFPDAMERVLLGVAANQAAIALQEAHRLAGQRRIAEQLDRRVAARTRALQAANRGLKAALAEIDALKDALQRENAQLREAAAAARGGLAPWQLQSAKAMLESDLHDLPLARIAAECGLSVRHFSRAFRQSTGMPPHRWLLRQRVERAKALLADRSLSLADVALACGFGDQSHFTRVFAAVAGHSPGVWRRVRLPDAVRGASEAGCGDARAMP
jgi:AraC-like DNA-binding protein